LPYDDPGSPAAFLGRAATTAGLDGGLNAAVDAVSHAGAVAWSAMRAPGGVHAAAAPTLLRCCLLRRRYRRRARSRAALPDAVHFGEKDAHIPLSDVQKIRAAFPQGEYHLYAAGHGFNCTDRDSHDATAAHQAFQRTLEFFRKYLG